MKEFDKDDEELIKKDREIEIQELLDEIAECEDTLLNSKNRLQKLLKDRDG